MTTDTDIYDTTIIGGGPTGLYAAFYAGMRDMKTKIIDSLGQIGGQLSALYPEKYIYDVGGFPKVLAKDLVAMSTEQALQFGATPCLGEKVIGLVRGEDGTITLTTEKGTGDRAESVTHRTKTVIIAAGVGAFLPRTLDIPGVDALVDRGIQYFVTDTASLAGRRLVIIGGGDSAFDWAMNLSDAAASCLLIHRSDKFRAHEETIHKVKSGKTEIRTFHELKAVHGDERLTGITIFDNRTGEEFDVECDNLLINTGFLTNLGPIKEWGLNIIKNAVSVNARMETNIPGVYAAGDICTYDGKLKLIATGMGEAGTAANFAKTFLDPAAKAFPGHSSDTK